MTCDALDTASNHRYDVYQDQTQYIPVHRASGNRIVLHTDSLEKVRLPYSLDRSSSTTPDSECPPRSRQKGQGSCLVLFLNRPMDYACAEKLISASGSTEFSRTLEFFWTDVDPSREHMSAHKTCSELADLRTSEL